MREWNLPPGKYRARDHAHYNAQGYAIVVGAHAAAGRDIAESRLAPVTDEASRCRAVACYSAPLHDPPPRIFRAQPGVRH